MRRGAAVAVLAIACGPTPTAPVAPPTPPPSSSSSAPLLPAEKPRFVSLAAGRDHACVVERSGRVVCWGDDRHGQLGDGPPAPTGTAKCFPPATGAEPIAEPLLAAGAQECVGYRASRATPVVVRAAGFVAVTAGARHTCGLRTDRTVWCWGDNNDDQCGAHGYANHLGTPMKVPSIAAADEVVAGEAHTCARETGGPWRCWGRDAKKLVAPVRYAPDGPDAAELAPLGDAPLRASGFRFACVADEAGVRCLGDNQLGQLGGGRSPGLLRDDPPGPVSGVTDAVQISTEGDHACAVLRSGRVRCWGGGHAGVLGWVLPHATFWTTPLELAALDDAVEVHTSYLRTCVLRKTGAVACYGGAFGEYPKAVEPVGSAPLFENDHATTLAADSTHACWVRDKGTLGCSGEWEHGTAPIPSFKPVYAKIVTDVRALIADSHRTCALQNGGGVVCFGDRFEGFDPPRPYGQRPTWKAPQLVAARKSAVEIAMGDDWLCWRVSSGLVECPIVHGKAVPPKQRRELAKDAIAIGRGDALRVCVVHTDGQVDCTSLDEPKAEPAAIAGLTEVVSLDGGCAVRRDGSVWCWGDPRTTGRGGVPDWSVAPVPVLLPK